MLIIEDRLVWTFAIQFHHSNHLLVDPIKNYINTKFMQLLYKIQIRQSLQVESKKSEEIKIITAKLFDRDPRK